jgi:drug/metabolite transporter (DMT)-like permease
MFPEPGEHPQHRRPLWLAALVTTFVVPAFYVGYEAAQALVTRGSLASDGRAVSPLFGIMFAGVMVTAFSMYVVGLPLVLALRREGRLTLPYVCSAAAAAGVAGVLAVVLAFDSELHPALLAFGAGFGLLAGLVFGLVAGVRLRRQPAEHGAP